MKGIIFILLCAVMAFSAEVNVYSHRHYDADKLIYNNFTKKTGIKVNVVKADADTLIKRMQNEGKNSPADLFLAADVARLYRAQMAGVLAKFDSPKLKSIVPSKYREKNGMWYGIAKRARIIVYNKDKINAGDITTYEDLTKPQYKGKVLIRSSANIYNQSLLASFIAQNGEQDAKKWAKDMVANFARAPKGSDRDQMRAIAGGVGDIGVVNSYYLGLLLKSTKPNDVSVGEKMAILFPNQKAKEAGTHVNISGAGITKHSPNRANAEKLLEYLLDGEAQKIITDINHEYPMNNDIAASPLLLSWGEFRASDTPVELFGKYNVAAVKIFNEVGWK